jgi:outer membrane protein TolC
MTQRLCELGVVGCFLVAQIANAAEVSRALPSPLTLEYALSLADESHPTLLLSAAEVASAQAERLRVDANYDWDIYIEARARYVEPAKSSTDLSHDDNRIGVVVSKDIYDFGKHSAQLRVADYEVDARRFHYLDARTRRRQEIMQRFFDVLLADLFSSRNNEELATAYVSFDRLRQHKEVGQASELLVLEAEARVQRARLVRNQSQAQQRETRARLAEALNRPTELPETLDIPKLAVLSRPIPEVEALQSQAVTNNYLLQAMRTRVAAAEQRIAVARAQDNAVVKGSAEAFNYSRDLGANDEVRVGVTLTVPIYSGRRDDAVLAHAQAQLQRARAELHLVESEVRQSVLSLWLELDNLRQQREAMVALRRFRELNLDRSRALYELEVKADLGDAMVLMTDAEYLSAQTDYKMVHAWLKLDSLTGQVTLPTNDVLNKPVESMKQNDKN